MKIGIYNPYMDTQGGGERYTLTLASHWSKAHTVSVFWDNKNILNEAQGRLDIDLSRIKVTRNIFRASNVFKKLLLSRQYDLIFVLSDGSIPSSLATLNILHYQVPFPKVSYSPIKLWRYQAVVCNSDFTKRALDARVSQRAIVIYPPVCPVEADGRKKENLILSIGRFSEFHTTKKQHVLIEAFAKGFKNTKWNGWRLVLAGGFLPGDQDYVDALKKKTKGLPICIEPNISHDQLTDYYCRASVYWHAAGYGETDPRWMEHFGITTVEAMSAGAVPVVFAGGGQPEVVDDGKNGFLWRTVDELLGKTNDVIMNKDGAMDLRKNAIEKSKQFSVNRFCDAFDALLTKIAL
ncbi:MAG: glycosyltransferase family 4 protein [Patescibacteria group bacterium]